MAADDGGHEDAPGNPSLGWIDDDNNAGGTAHFGVDEQARVDYGYNGIERTATVSKAIIAQYSARIRGIPICGDARTADETRW